MKITVDGIRYDLGSMVALGVTTQEEGGVRITEVYFGRKSHRLIIETYSIWQRGNSGCCVGTEYEVIEPDSSSWPDEMQDALDHGAQAHHDMLTAAMDEHCPALTD